MIELEFARLTIEEFKEFRGSHKLNLAKLGLGVHFVSGDNQVEPRLGSNGAGKSSIFDAICWCLFGRTVKGLRGTDMISWGGKAKPRVWVDIYVDGKLMTITRSTATNGLWINDKVVAQESIDQLLGLSFTIFSHTILLGQGAPLFFDLKPTDKMSLLSEALILDRWEERSKVARKEVDRIDQLVHETQGRNSEVERSLAEAEKSIADLTERKANWDGEQAIKAKQRDKELVSLRKLLESTTRLKGEHDLALDGAETEARATRKRKAKIGDDYAEAAANVAATSASASVLIAELSKLHDRVLEAGDNCPTCGQSLKGTSLAKHNAEMKRRAKELESELAASRALLKTFTNARDKIEKDLKKASDEQKAFEDKADDARDGFTRAQVISAETAGMIKRLEREKEAQEKETNPYSALWREARKQQRRILDVREEAAALLDELSRKRIRTHYWVQGFRDLRLYLIHEVLDELQGVTQTLLPQIGLDGWIVELAMEKETQAGKVVPGLNVNIFKPGLEKAVKWESWSGGEGQRLRLVGAMALSEVLLRRAGVNCDMLILDEPTRHLSPEGVAETVDFLIDRGHDYQIFYVDHQAIESKRFMSNVHIVRDAAGARIESSAA